MEAVAKRKSCPPVNSKPHEKWISKKDFDLGLKKPCRRFPVNSNRKMKIAFQVQVAKHFMNDGFNGVLEDQLRFHDTSKTALHISPPDSPLHTSCSSAKRLKYVDNGRTNKFSSWNCEFEMTQTPSISHSLSPVKATTDCKIRTPKIGTNFSLPTRKVYSSRKPVIKNVKRELFQDGVIVSSVGKHVESKENLESRISPCCSPLKSTVVRSSPLSSISSPHNIDDDFQDVFSSKPDTQVDIVPSDSPLKDACLKKCKTVCDSDANKQPSSTRRENTGTVWLPDTQVDIVPSDSPLKDTRPKKCKTLCDSDVNEQPLSTRKENTGTVWLNGITWQPKTPDKTGGKSVLPDSSKKRRYYVSGGLAQRLKQLEVREQTSQNLQRHMVSSKGEAYASACVKTVNFSSPAFPLAYCQDISSSEEVIVVIPQAQIPDVDIGSTVRISRSCLEMAGTGLRITQASEDLVISKPSELCRITSDKPRIVYKWQCPCRKDRDLKSTTCPANVTLFGTE